MLSAARREPFACFARPIVTSSAREGTVPTYTYAVRSPSAELLRGELEASNLPAALVRLSADGGRVLRVEEQRPGILAPKPRITEHELALLFRHLGAMVESGVSLGEGIDVLRRDSPNQHLHHVLDEVGRALRKGRPLSEALERFPFTFSPAHLALVRAGERSGQLSALLADIADHLEQTGKITRRLTTALIYPAVVGSLLIVIAVSFLTFVLPQVIAVYRDLGVERGLPWMTRAVIRVSGIAVPALLILAAIAVMGGLTWAGMSRSRSGAAVVDALKLRMPFLGQVVHHTGLARFAGTLGLLLRHQVPALEALDLAGEASGSPSIARGARQTAAALSRGKSFAASLDESTAFPKSLTARVSAAEAGGTLPEALVSTARFYGGYAEHLAMLFGAVIEPFFIIILGIAVAFIMGGVFAPLLQAVNELMNLAY